MIETNEELVPPSLSPSLLSDYSDMNERERKAFNKAFMLMWRSLVPYRLMYDVLHLYWGADLIRRKHRLTNHQFALLTYLYMSSNRGKLTINSLALQKLNPMNMAQSWTRNTLVKFRAKGFIIRLNRDASQPYLSRSISRNKIFIQLTGRSIALIDTMHKELYNMIVNTTIKDITTGKTKGRNIVRPL